MVAAAAAEEVAVVVDEVAVVLVEGAERGWEAAAECRDHRHPLVARHRLVDQLPGRVGAEVFRALLAASGVQAAHVRVALAARDRLRGHRRDSRRDRDQAQLTSAVDDRVVRVRG